MLFNLKRLGFLKVFFSGRKGGQCNSPFIFQEELVQCQCNFIELLNNLFKVGQGKEKTDMICNILMALDYL